MVFTVSHVKLLLMSPGEDITLTLSFLSSHTVLGLTVMVERN